MRKKTHEEFVAQMNNINKNIIILGKYKKSSEKIKCKCSICDNEWYATPDNLLQGKGCIKCYRKKQKENQTKSTETFVSQMKLVNSDIEIIGRYKNSHEKIKCRCLKHNIIFESSPTHLLSGKNGCKQCRSEKISIKNRKQNEQFVDDLSKINSNIIPLEKYQNSYTPIKVQCKKCGHVWTPAPCSLTNQKTGCPKCNTSKGELRIKAFFEKNKISYIHQKKFKDLLGVGKRCLSYDFYLPDFNLLIEYQGQFHDGRAFSSKVNAYYDIQKEHDKRKKDYALLNKYNFLEIWYTDFNNIEIILLKTLYDFKDPVTTTAS